MADEKIVTSIVANSDFSGLIADVQRVTGSLSKLQQEFAGSNRALAGQISAANAMFNQTMLKTGQFSSHFVSLTSDVEKFGRNLDSGRLKLRDYFRVYQDHARTSGGLIRDLAKQQVQLQNAILQPLGRNAQGLMQYNVHIPRGLDLTKNKASLLKQELQIMNKVIQDGGVQLINWGKNTQWAGRQLTVGLTLPLAAFGKAAADAFKVADQELTRLTKVYGDVAGTSAQELTKVRNQVSATAKELSSAMGVNFAETIALAADIAATGKTGNELLASVSETTRLAVLGEVDRQEAMKATLAIQSAFKQNTEELADSINFLNAVENQTSTTLNDLVEAIPKAGPVIKGLGGDVQDLALYLTAMREGGINASEGANALKSALASLINPTDVAVDKFKGFGIDLLGIVKSNAGDVTATLFALQSALDKLDPLSKQQAIEQLFGKFQFSRLNALFENLGRQGSQTLQVLDLMSASAAELEAVASRELTAVTESAAGRFRRAVEGLKADLAGVGEDFLNIGTKLINILGGIIDFAQKLPDPIKKVLAFGGAFTAILGPVIMLTGVLANFFGYIIKGLGHFKALFKGAEGFRLLTPEIMAAKNASEMLSNEFYSDAKAADTLRLAIERLNEDLIGLQVNATNATKATSGLGQVLITSAGTPIMPMGGLGGARQVIQGHPLLGGESRAAAHLNPRNPNDPSSIFGLTLQPIPLNRRIGRTPQILMSERLPDIEGLTSVGGVSTGVVASEHARYAALMATLGMQSRQEIEALKKTIGLGGQVSQEFIATFDDILPMTQRLTANAAAQSAAIVAELRAGKITAETALARIFAANAELERMLGVEVSAYAASRGRTIDLTKAPLIDQPVVDVAGKPNTRGMFRTGIFRDVMDAVGRATRTRTFGGPYSIETTRRLNKGGGVFYNNGDQVPGPNINADIVPAMLTPGEFVIRRDVAQMDPDGMRALNEGRAMVVPFEANMGGQVPAFQYLNGGGPLSMLFRARAALIGGARKAGSRSTRALSGTSPERMIYEQMRNPSGTRGAFWAQSPLLREGAPGSGQVVGHLYTNAYKKLMSTLGATPSARGSSPQLTIDQLRSIGITVNSAGQVFDILPNNVMTFGRSFNTKLGKGTATSRDWISSNPQPEHLTGLTHFLLSLGFGEDDIRQIRKDVLLDVNSKVSRIPGRINEYQFGNLVTGSIRSRLRNLNIPQSMPMAANRGGRVRRYNRGGMVPGYRRGGGVVSRNRMFYGDNIDYSRTPFGMMQAGIVPFPGQRTSAGVQPQQMMPAMPGMGAMLGMQAASFGGMFAGQSIGSRFGSGGAMAGSIIGSMLPMMMMGGMGRGRDISAIYEKSIFSGTKFGQSMAGQAMQGGKLSSTLARLALGLTKVTAGFGLATAAVGVGVMLFRRHQEVQDRVANSFGMTAEQAKKAGLNYTNLNSRIKESIEAAKALQERNQLVYQSLTMANTPLRLTIEQYKKLKQQVKDTMPDVVENINKMNRVEAKDYAVQLKTQFMAYGDTVEEATKKVYALFAVSDKKFMAGAVIAQKAFSDIKNSADAAAKSIDLYNKAVEVANSKGQARAVDTALQSIDAAIQNTLKSSKDQMTYYDAMKKTLDEINSKTGRQVTLTKETIRGIAAQNAELASVLNTTDTVVSAWAKYQLLLKGINLDLSVLNANQAIAVNNAVQLVSQNVAASLIDTKGILSDENKLLKEKEAQYRKLETAARGERVQTQISRRDRIKALQEEIKKINEAAEARKKALRQQIEDEDIRLEIQKKQLEYQDMIAAGNLSGAAQIQLDIEKLTNQQQLTLTERAIDEQTKKLTDPLQAEIDRLNDKTQDMADAAAIAAESMQTLGKEIANLKNTIADVTSSILTIVLGKMFDPNFENTPAGRAAYAALSKLLKDTGNVPAGFKQPEAPTLDTSRGAPGPSEVTTFENQSRNATPTAVGRQMYDAVASGIEKGLANNPLVVRAQNVVIETGAVGKSENILGRSDLERILRQGGNSPEFTERQLRSKSLDPQVIKDVIRNLKLNAGDTFQYNGVVYNVDRGHNAFLGAKGSIKKAMGGRVFGPGTSTSDSIPAYLSNGEYVINASAVDHYGVGTFDALNAKRFKDGGPLTPSMGTPDPTQSFLNKFFFGTRYVGGNMKMLKGEVPFGPGSIGKAASALKPFSKFFKDFEIAFTPGTVPDLKTVIGKHMGEPVTIENYFDAIKKGASWPLLTEFPAHQAGGMLNVLRVYQKGLGEEIGHMDWDPVSGIISTLSIAKRFQRQGIGTELWNTASQLGPIAHSAVRSLAGDNWARKVGGMIPELKHLVPPGLAGGGYVTRSFTPTMNIPSFGDGVNMLYGDTIAQLHKGEAVIPEKFNPWNPNASAPIGGATYNIQPVINAAAGMDEVALARMATNMTIKELEKIDSRRMSMNGRVRTIGG